MSYPFIGMAHILPGGKTWDAKAIEELLKNGAHIYLEDEPVGVVTVQFDRDSKNFEVVLPDEKIGFVTDKFIELAAWVAFMGRDFL